MNHLTPESWLRLRRGALEPHERASLLAHLADPCEACDAAADAADDLALDCAVDAALARVSTAPPPDTTRMLAVERRVLRSLTPRPRLSPWLALVPLAAAAGAAFLTLTPALGPTRAATQQLKGPAAPPSLTAVASLRPGAPLEPLSTQPAWPTTAELFFTYTLGEAAYVYLARVGGDGSIEAFYPPIGVPARLEPAGTRALTVAGTVHGYSLQALSGRQRFTVLASPSPLRQDELAAALRAAAPLSVVELEVAGP